MSKAVLLSIRPKYCELIASGEKTIEVRKTRPRLETPFKCYIYQTMIGYVSKSKENDVLVPATYGKIIGEFVCDNIDRYNDEVVNSSSLENFCGWNDFDLNRACIHPDDLEEYAGGKDLYGWHISDLVIYYEPKALSEFHRPCPYPSLSCLLCDKAVRDADTGLLDDCCNKITRPPQSWCYVEAMT